MLGAVLWLFLVLGVAVGGLIRPLDIGGPLNLIGPAAGLLESLHDATCECCSNVVDDEAHEKGWA